MHLLYKKTYVLSQNLNTKQPSSGGHSSLLHWASIMAAMTGVTYNFQPTKWRMLFAWKLDVEIYLGLISCIVLSDGLATDNMGLPDYIHLSVQYH